jgi:hypothetical protein
MGLSITQTCKFVECPPRNACYSTEQSGGQDESRDLQRAPKWDLLKVVAALGSPQIQTPNNTRERRNAGEA